MASDNWLPVREIEFPGKVTPKGYRSGLEVWLRRPHVLNRRLCAVNPLRKVVVTSNGLTSTWIKLANHIIDNQKLIPIDDCVDSLTNVFNVEGKFRDVISVEVRELLPKKYDEKVTEVVIIDDIAGVAAFILGASEKLRYVSADHSYAFRFVQDRSILQLLVPFDDRRPFVDFQPSSDILWIADKVMPKIIQWAKESDSQECIPTLKRVLPSLSLISAVDYATVYQELKSKYGPHLVEIWPERTDPSKFVYEDIAIASYLLVLWRKERASLSLTDKQSFVDLGCGNGLLTHILASEGHCGLGVDIKKRNIWNLYGPQTRLIEGPITPSSDCLYPDYDWIIGNHSDELTPWIPVIAARSSRRTRFFVLPCCAHNFDSKFQRRNSRLSQYQDYLEYVAEIGRVCGFHVERDKLRIPSTKRLCLIGKSRIEEEWQNVDAVITKFIQSQCVQSTRETDTQSWATNFKTREAVQPTRNCTTIENTVKEHIVSIVFNTLLSSASDENLLKTKCGRWNAGGSVHLSKLAQRIEPHMLQKLKNEFGGLQTLLRNHYHIFQVIQGMVTLRNYLNGEPRVRRRKQDRNRKPNSKEKRCWFYTNHPDGCPISAETCKFSHDSLSREIK